MDTFTARTPADLLALVPIMIGFHPQDSVVLLTFGPRVDGAELAECSNFHARIDLPVTEDEQRAVATTLRDVVARHRAGLVALILYSDDAGLASGFADVMVPLLLDDEVAVLDVLRADGERYFTLPELDDGHPYDVGSHPFTASGVLRGRVVHESRAALADSLVGTDLAGVRVVAEAADAFVDGLMASGINDSLTTRFASEARWLQRFLRTGSRDRDELAPADCARMLVLLSFDALREVAWSDLRRGNAASYVQLLRTQIRYAPEDLTAGIGGLLGLAAWLAGDGALAWCAIDRCLASDPDDQLAHHVSALLESATPPSVWAPLAAESLPVFTAAAAERASLRG